MCLRLRVGVVVPSPPPARDPTPHRGRTRSGQRPAGGAGLRGVYLFSGLRLRLHSRDHHALRLDRPCPPSPPYQTPPWRQGLAGRLLRRPPGPGVLPQLPQLVSGGGGHAAPQRQSPKQPQQCSAPNPFRPSTQTHGRSSSAPVLRLRARGQAVPRPLPADNRPGSGYQLRCQRPSGSPPCPCTITPLPPHQTLPATAPPALLPAVQR